MADTDKADASSPAVNAASPPMELADEATTEEVIPPRVKKDNDAPKQKAAQRVLIGMDLSYSVNKKSYNLLPSASIGSFCEKSLSLSASCIDDVVSFGADHYGLILSSSGSDSSQKLSGFALQKSELSPLNASVREELSSILKTSSTVVSNTPSGAEIVLFDNASSTFRTIHLLDKAERARIQSDNRYLVSSDGDDTSSDTNTQTQTNGATNNGSPDDEVKQEADSATSSGKKEKVKEKEKKKSSSSQKKKKKKSVGPPKLKVKSSISKVFKHLLLTSGGSLYSLQKSFHKKYVNNQRVMDVKCDGSRCALCLDENGVLWSFGVNLFGKLGLKRNDKKQVYTNPREISIFKAYKVADFGITNKCCIAVCANGSIYGWGAYCRSAMGKDADIWYTPHLISSNESVQYEADGGGSVKGVKSKWRVFAGFRFVMLLNETSNALYVINTEFGYMLREKAKYGLKIQCEQVNLPEGLKVVNVVPSNESAIIVAEML